VKTVGGELFRCFIVDGVEPEFSAADTAAQFAGVDTVGGYADAGPEDRQGGFDG
jgi:hypothetical protein